MLDVWGDDGRLEKKARGKGRDVGWEPGGRGGEG